MPIEFETDLVESFFGAKIVHEELGPDETIGVVNYAGKTLKSQLLIREADEHISISGDLDKPFGPDSFYEISIPCDSITLVKDGYHPDQTALHFWYGSRKHRHNLMMMLLKRPDGDLKVWPGCVWPPRHKHHSMIWDGVDAEPYT